MVNVVNRADEVTEDPVATGLEGPRTIACIDIQMRGVDSRLATTPGPGFVLDHVRQAVRADDRVCPMSRSRLIVEFGPVASGVLPQVLGDRLARSVSRRLTEGGSTGNPSVSVGMAEPEPRLASSELGRRAMLAARAGSERLGRRRDPGGHHPQTVVTVDRLLSPRPTASPASLPMHRRNLYHYESGHIRGTPVLHAGAELPRGPLELPTDEAPLDLTVLVVDPAGAAGTRPGLAALTGASVAEQLGCRTAAVAVSPDDPLALSIDDHDLDLVVLILDGGWAGHSVSWRYGAWGVPARITASYRASGVPVVAVRVGAGAGALAGCVAQGALASSGLDLLAEALRSLDRMPFEDALQVAEVGQSERFRALVGLTASERRVLFYLTEGWAAQEIADELVVSLTTVRSHIRSVLRKLAVRSQLAAVAVANSRDLEHEPSPVSV